MFLAKSDLQKSSEKNFSEDRSLRETFCKKLKSVPPLCINCDRQTQFSQNERRRADLQKLPEIFKFLPRDLVMIFQSFVMILPRFFDFERP